jgi:uncharacterized protein (TIGR02594 family)
MARISELQTLIAPRAVTPPASAATTSTSTGTSSSFNSMLQGAMGQTAGGGTSTATAGSAALGLGGTSALGKVAVPAGGSIGQRMVAIAANEVGVAESPPGSNNSPRIAQYRSATAGAPGPGPWCAYFTSWVAKQAGAPIGDNGSGYGAVASVWSWAQRTGHAVPKGQQPAPGDLIVFNGHIGIVERVGTDGKIHTIEGNSSDRVTRRERSSGEVVGYVRVG